jgi:hypothetical protein
MTDLEQKSADALLIKKISSSEPGGIQDEAHSAIPDGQQPASRLPDGVLSHTDASDQSAHHSSDDGDDVDAASDHSSPAELTAAAGAAVPSSDAGLSPEKSTSGVKRPADDGHEPERAVAPPVRSGRAAGGAAGGRSARTLQRPQARRLSLWLWLHQSFPYPIRDEVRRSALSGGGFMQVIYLFIFVGFGLGKRNESDGNSSHELV